MSWTLSYYSERLRQEILSLPNGILASYIRLAGVLSENGPWLPMPYARPMGAGLYELRPRGREGIGRVFYCAVEGRQIIILHTFIKKSQQTPEHELAIARKRQKEIDP